MGVAEAAGLLGLYERSIRQLRSRMERDGPRGLVHGNRGLALSGRLNKSWEGLSS